MVSNLKVGVRKPDSAKVLISITRFDDVMLERIAKAMNNTPEALLHARLADCLQGGKSLSEQPLKR